MRRVRRRPLSIAIAVERRFVAVNPAMTRLFGYAREQLPVVADDERNRRLLGAEFEHVVTGIKAA